MNAVSISKIRIDGAGRLHMTPASNPNETFQFIYRAARGVEWDDGERGFCPFPESCPTQTGMGLCSKP
jgi:hypothetical protein